MASVVSLPISKNILFKSKSNVSSDSSAQLNIKFDLLSRNSPAPCIDNAIIKN